MQLREINKKITTIAQGGISLLHKVDDIMVKFTYVTKKVEDTMSTKSESIRAIEHVDMSATYAI